MPTLLVILAHPDDESFGPGGTLAKYAHTGTAVHYLCGTRGESGTVDADKLNGYADVAALRTNELLHAAEALKLAGVHFLGYRDSGMVGTADNALPNTLHMAPLNEVAQRIIGYVEKLKPDAILTHDQFGGYGHPDHIKLHQATMRAYELLYGITWRKDGELWQVASGPTQGKPPRLYFTAFPKGLIKFGVRVLPIFRQDPRKFGRNKDIDLVQIASWDIPVTTRVNTQRFEEIKQIASAKHASQQGPGQMNPFIRFLFRRNEGKEFFSRAYPPFTKGERSETGLFGD
jgi:LmbE family N-acetylglucosaminyl deacetylase